MPTAPRTAASGVPCSATTLRIGSMNNPTVNYAFFGRMADARVWNYARSAQEIADYKDHRLKGREAGLLGYWPFDGGAIDGTSVHVTFENATFTLKPPRAAYLSVIVR